MQPKQLHETAASINEDPDLDTCPFVNSPDYFEDDNISENQEDSCLSDSSQEDENLDESSYGDSNTTNNTLNFGLEISNMEAETLSDNEKPIYPNARITNAVSVLLIMTYAITHKLSGEALKDPHALIQSLYKFKRYFDMLKHPIKKHHYCPICSMPIDQQCLHCPNLSCTQEFTEHSKPFFIEIPLVDQLKVLFN